MKNTEKKPINIEIGKNILKYRDICGYTREELAEKIDVSARFIADVEVGTVGISLTTLKNICEVLGVSSDRILWDFKHDLRLDERVAHIDKKYVNLVGEVIQKQIEIITLANKEENLKKTRK